MTPGTETAEDYTGHELDGETGMHYAGARYYMSALGRWNGPDPILREQSPAKLLKDGKVQAFRCPRIPTASTIRRISGTKMASGPRQDVLRHRVYCVRCLRHREHGAKR